MRLRKPAFATAWPHADGIVYNILDIFAAKLVPFAACYFEKYVMLSSCPRLIQASVRRRFLDTSFYRHATFFLASHLKHVAMSAHSLIGMS